MLLFCIVAHFPQDIKTFWTLIMLMLIQIIPYEQRSNPATCIWIPIWCFYDFNDARCEQRPIPPTCIRMAAHARASSSCVVSENIPHRMHSHTGVKSVKNLTKQTGKYATTKSQIPNCRWITSKLRTGNPRAFVKKGDPKICVDYLNAKADNAKSLWITPKSWKRTWV